MLSRGDEVIVLDDLSTGSLDNVAHLRKSPHFECVVGSAADAALAQSLIDNCDVIIHLAAPVGGRRVAEKPVRTIENSLRATGVGLAAAAQSPRAEKSK